MRDEGPAVMPGCNPAKIRLNSHNPPIGKQVSTSPSLDVSGILNFLSSYSTYYIVGHKEPDGDCIGSQLALGSFLERRGKKTVLLSAGPFTRTEIASWSSRFAAHIDAPANESRAIIVLESEEHTSELK